MTSKRQLIAAAAVLVLAACTQRSTVSGRVPENMTRERDEFATKAKKPDRQKTYDEREERAKAREAAVEKVDPAEARIGVAGTHVFHVPNCPLLQDVPAGDRIQFTSKWDGVDAAYKPCPECRAMQ